MSCEHKNKTYIDGMASSAEAPYDTSDFWWSVTCDDCNAELAEGDFYSRPRWVEELAS